ncbi:GAF and ANTAR domain-containing protein [Streptomyces paromomycinus]|uniref:Transcriptional regulator n=1 Tax=Streptomyces paromomycinus TaxID=92743 RepID=A0A401W5U5_STREY|nr:GAF and ANTAR domain-containing protein [Streptomyces paromomycinus]GCD44733.1 transcriptional regulator [Streptomyces paromomycinus]
METDANDGRPVMFTTEREARIAQVVIDLVHRPADFDPLELLHDLTARAVELLPVRGASITVLDDGRVSYITASDEVCRELTENQVDLYEGPCIDSARTRKPLEPAALDERWPRFAPYAHEAGISAMAAVSLRLPQTLLGALNLFMTHLPCMGGPDLQLAQTLADTTGLTLAHRHELADKNTVLAQLQTALDSRLTIEQAKGMLAGRFGIDMDEAFARLRNHARYQQRKLSDVAAQVARGDVPDAFRPAR